MPCLEKVPSCTERCPPGPAGWEPTARAGGSQRTVGRRVPDAGVRFSGRRVWMPLRNVCPIRRAQPRVTLRPFMSGLLPLSVPTPFVPSGWSGERQLPGGRRDEEGNIHVTRQGTPRPCVIGRTRPPRGGPAPCRDARVAPALRPGTGSDQSLEGESRSPRGRAPDSPSAATIRREPSLWVPMLLYLPLKPRLSSSRAEAAAQTRSSRSSLRRPARTARPPVSSSSLRRRR